ncbi:MAG: hypothetical protein Q8L01_02310 [Candidatus Woesebacteria bacterium]|nr:hypothetical protein [Candidatus Woesebacteria bacterium]
MKFDKKKNILFIDFNGVISFNLFWVTIKNPKHALYKYFSKIENFIFRDNKDVAIRWMSGKLTTEEVHDMLSKALRIRSKDAQTIQKLFIEDCKNIDISDKILSKLSKLKKLYRVVLVTDNMDTFHRFTVPNNPQLMTVFDEIHDSYNRGKFKKTNDGELFLEICEKYGIPVKSCILIDDSKNNCAYFSALGGRAYTPKSEMEVLNILKEIESDGIKRPLHQGR